MHKGRLEAFSDGVIAILITIMVLEMKAPHGSSLAELYELWPVFLSYALSFIYLGIYWNNHHHLFQAVEHIDGKVLWANLHLLFWLSLISFTTTWMSENHFAPIPVAIYGVNLLLNGVAYYILTLRLKAIHKPDSKLHKAIKQTFKERISIWLYLFGIGLTWFSSALGYAIFVGVALIWLIPDKRIERTLN